MKEMGGNKKKRLKPTLSVSQNATISQTSHVQSTWLPLEYQNELTRSDVSIHPSYSRLGYP